MTTRTIDRRARNRALLARQLLLQRAPVRPTTAVRRLVGLQAQTPRSPYTALWSRLRDFDPTALSLALEQRRLLRIALMRSTIHLVTAGDALALRPLMAPVLHREITSATWAPLLTGIDLDQLAAAARSLVEREPCTPAALGAALANRWTDRDPRALAHAARSLLPLVQVPPRGLWDRSGATRLTTAESWLGRPIAVPDWDSVALRYLGAFGPATAADLVAWCRVTGLAEVLERLRPRLRTLSDERGRTLFDLPNAPRPSGRTAAPPRFLPDYDNVLLGHADRDHVFARDHRAALRSPNGVLPGTVLLDGFVGATWSLRREKSWTRLIVRPFDPIPPTRAAAVREEATALARFLADDTDRLDVEIA